MPNVVCQMPRRHYRRVIRGTQDAWVHCGRPLARVQSTRRLQDVTCAVCRRYIAKGLAYGYRERSQEAAATPDADHA